MSSTPAPRRARAPLPALALLVGLCLVGAACSGPARRHVPPAPRAEDGRPAPHLTQREEPVEDGGLFGTGIDLGIDLDRYFPDQEAPRNTAPLSLDQIERAKREGRPKDPGLASRRSHYSYKRYKGPLDNTRKELHKVTCLNRESGGTYIYFEDDKWCTYYAFFPPRCYKNAPEAMEAVCRDEEKALRKADEDGEEGRSSRSFIDSP